MGTMQDKLIQQLQDMDQVYDDYAKANGLTYLSLMVLEELYECGNSCTQKQISADTRYPKQSINLVIKAFLADGLVVLQEVPENRKVKQIALTEQGRQLCARVVVPLLEAEERAMAAMGENEQQELLRLLGMYGQQYCSQLRQALPKK